MRKNLFQKLAAALLAAGIAAASTVLPASAATWTPNVSVSSGAVYLVNVDTGVVLYEKNANKRMYPASLTKMMTAALVVSHIKNLDEPLTFQAQDVDPIKGTGGTTGGFVAGETITVRQVLFCMLLESANEGANALARVTAGSDEKFVAMMNEQAKKLGCTNTHFTNPHGLHNPDHYSSAHDLYLIARYAMSFPVLREIVSTEKYLVPQTNKHKAHYIRNTNLLLNDASSYYYSYCQGIKTGTTTPAGRCLASYARNPDGETYYGIVLDAPKNASDTNVSFLETRALYRWAFGTFRISPLLDQKDITAQLPLKLAWNVTTLSLYPASQLNSLVPRKADLTKVKLTPHLTTKTAFAPITKGERFGTADVLLDGKKVGTVNLVANDNIARSAPLAFVYAMTVFFHSAWFIVIVAALIVLFVLFLIFSPRFRLRSRAKRQGNFLADSRPMPRRRRRRRRRRRF